MLKAEQWNWGKVRLLLINIKCIKHHQQYHTMSDLIYMKHEKQKSCEKLYETLPSQHVSHQNENIYFSPTRSTTIVKSLSHYTEHENSKGQGDRRVNTGAETGQKLKQRGLLQIHNAASSKNVAQMIP